MTLIKSKFNYNQLSRSQVEGKRLYSCPDGSRVPSVTTILDRTKPLEQRQALAEWKKRVGVEKAQQITTEAAGRGTRMHKYLEDYIINGVITPPGTNPYSHQSHKMASTIINEGLININEIWGVEVSLYYPGLYAGTTDGLGLHCNEESIFDYKQSNKPKKEEYIEDYYLQLTAYALAHNEVYGTNIQKGVILMCVKPPEVSPGVWGDPTYQEFIIKSSKFDYWKNKWWDRVDEFYRNN